MVYSVFGNVILSGSGSSSGFTTGQTASVVIGQLDFTTTSTYNGSGTAYRFVQHKGGLAVTSGGKVLVSDAVRCGVLIWNSFPTSNGQAADLVLGSADVDTYPPTSGSGKTQLNGPTYVTSDGTRIFVTDSGNNRVLIWNSWPTASGAAADEVLGQSSFSGTSANTTATGLSNPQGLALINSKQLIVTDSGNYRHLIYNAK